MKHTTLICALACTALLAVACGDKQQQQTFEQLHSTGFGLGIGFDQQQQAVQDKLGQPQATEERLGGINKIDYYLPLELISPELSVQPVPGPDTPQLSLSYFEGKLRRLYNSWRPEDSTQPDPPFFIEPLKGVKLGVRKSAFTEVLGMPQEGMTGDSWIVRSKEGETITINASFVDVESAGEALCDSLLVVYAPAVETSRGEAYE